MKFSIFAPGTIGNVSSGFDILGLAIDGLGDTFHFETADNYSIRVTGRDANDIPTDPALNAVTIASESFISSLVEERSPSQCISNVGCPCLEVSDPVPPRVWQVPWLLRDLQRQALVPTSFCRPL
jgi:homoserine kinase